MKRAPATLSDPAMPRAMAKVLKDRAKSLGLSQKSLAQATGTSLPTIKRWLAGRGLTLQALFLLMEVLDITLADISKLVVEEASSSFQYTEKQESFFAANPGFLAFFDLLLLGSSVSDIARKFKLSPRSIQKYLSGLEKLKLVEVHPFNKVKLLVSGEPVWRADGILAQTFKRAAILDFLAKSESPPKLLLHQYTETELEAIKHHLSELSRLASAADKRGKMANSPSKAYGLLIGLSEFKWDLLDRVPELKR